MPDRDEHQPGESNSAGSEPGDRPDAPAVTSESPREDKRRFGSAFGILAFLVALGGGFWIGQAIQNRQVDWQGYDDRERYRVDLRGDEPQVGPDDALVTIIEFSDYECPYCQKAHGPLMEAVEDNDDVRLIFKHHPLPMHARAIPAARAAWAAQQQGKFWEMHDHLFEVGGKVDDIEQVAERLGLDVERFKRDMLSEAAGETLENDRYAASVLGIGSTPHFVVNGRHIRGALAESHWERVIELERDEAEVLVDGGVAPGDVYEHLMASAKARRAKPSSGPDPDRRHAVTGGEGRPSLGPDDALVTVVEFSDFQCPYCAKLGPVMHAIPERNADVRVVFRQLPLPNHPLARPAAKAALAAHRQDKFWEMHDALFAAGGEIGEDALVRIAEEIGLDMARFEADREDPAIEQMIAEDERVARGVGVGGTPAAFVNGRFVGSAQPAETFDGMISQEREIARALVDTGTPRAQVLELLLRQPKEE